MKILISQEVSPVKVIVAVGESTHVFAEFVGEEPYEVTEELANLIYMGFQMDQEGIVAPSDRMPVGNLTTVGEIPAVSLVQLGMELRTDMWWDEASNKASQGLGWLLDQTV